jgi:hypothetical protein
MFFKILLLILPIFLVSCSSFQGGRDVAQVSDSKSDLGGEVGNPLVQYDPEASVITCHDSELGYSFRFQYAGNWIEYKPKDAKNYSHCVTTTGINSKLGKRVLVDQGTGYDILKFERVDTSDSGKTSIHRAHLIFKCEDLNSSKIGVGILSADRVWYNGLKTTSVDIYLPFSNRKVIKLGYDHLLGQNVYADQPLPQGITCNNLKAPRYEPIQTTHRD